MDTDLEPDYHIEALPELVRVLDRSKSEREGAM